MTREERMMLWNFTLGYPLFWAKLARERILLTKLNLTVYARERIARLIRDGNDPTYLEPAYSRWSADGRAVREELDKVFNQPTGRWEDISWLARYGVSRAMSNAWVIRVWSALQDMAAETWFYITTPVWLVQALLFPKPTQSTEHGLADIERLEAKWLQKRNDFIRLVNEMEAEGYYSPERAAARRQDMYVQTQDVHETVRRLREVYWQSK